MQVELKVFYSQTFSKYQFLTKVYQDMTFEAVYGDFSSKKPISVYDSSSGFHYMFTFEHHTHIDQQELIDLYVKDLRDQLEQKTDLSMNQVLEATHRAHKALVEMTQYQTYQSNTTHFNKYSPSVADETDFWKHYSNKYKAAMQGQYYNTNMPTGGGEFADLSKVLPGVKNLVEYPCEHGHSNLVKEPKQDSIRSVIIHLNDVDKWTREQIADWLDELHDSGQINIEFEVEVDEKGGES